MKNFRYLYANMDKTAAAALTPEAEQAAMQPPMDPAMAGGMPPQGVPMDPAMAGGMPPAGGVMPMPPQGAAIPPEILQDKAFVDFLQQAMGIVLDPNSGMFMDPQSGQPIPPDMIIQAYQVFQQEQAMAAQGGAPGGMPPQGAPVDPAMAGGMPPAGLPEDIINQIASTVMSGVEATLQEYTAALEKKISALMDKLDIVKGQVDSMQSTTDKRTQNDIDEDQKLREDIAADLQPTVKVANEITAPQQIVIPKAVSKKPVSLYGLIVGGKN